MAGIFEYYCVLIVAVFKFVKYCMLKMSFSFDLLGFGLRLGELADQICFAFSIGCFDSFA